MGRTSGIGIKLFSWILLNRNVSQCATLKAVSFGQFTKQFAKEAISGQVKDVIDSLRPAETAAAAESIGTMAPPVNSPGDNLAGVIMSQLQAMQAALKEDKELIVLCTTGLETLRVLEVFAPSSRVLVLTGIDTEQTITRVISAVESLQLVCKPMAVKSGTPPVRMRFVTPKPAQGK
jgi:hypothetical protein